MTTRSVLTAAWCFLDHPDPTQFALLGETDLSEARQDSSVVVPVDDFVSHGDHAGVDQRVRITQNKFYIAMQ